MKKIITYLILGAMIGSVNSFFLWVVYTYLPVSHSVQILVSSFLMAVFIIFIFIPLNKSVSYLVDKFIIKDIRDSQEDVLYKENQYLRDKLSELKKNKITNGYL